MECNFCKKIFKNKGGLNSHVKYCDSNPNKIKRFRSPNAGAKNGIVPWNKGKKIGRLSKWNELFPNEKIFVENSSYARHLIKKRILAENLLNYICSCCGIGPEWQGKPMPLILDHINGINNDNKLENLRFVCSNCDSQLPTYKSKNIKG